MPQNLLKNNFQVDKDIREFLGERIRKNFPPLKVESNISSEDFQNKYVLANKPVILRNIIDNWPAVKKWDLDFFATNYGDAKVRVNLYDAKNIHESSLQSLVDEINKATNEKPVYLQEWWFQIPCPDLLKDIEIPQHFSDDQNLKLLGYHNSTLWIGSKGAFTPIHQDTVYSNVWTAQIRGKKEWILFDKNAQLNADANGNPDYDEFLANPNNNISCTILQPGDVLYMPYKWWHRAFTLENAISVNTFFITDEIVKRYVKDIISIPVAAVLNKDLMQKHDPMRYNICMERVDMFSHLLGYNKENILNIKIPNEEPRAAK